jgi:branched-chain amino acid transport system substrate-binding protein
MHRSGIAVLGIALVTIGACRGADDARPTVTTTTTTVPSATTVHLDDGVFKVGLVVPSIGPGLEIGVSIEAAVKLAAEEINDEGGVVGQPVVVDVREEGDSATTAVLAVQELVQARADIIIGPTSSIATLAALSTAVDAGVLTCSPTASALALDDFPDNGLFIRTVPSDSLQAVALATLADDAGGARTALVYLDDPYGRPLAEHAQRALRAKGVSLATTAGFTAAEDSLGAAVDQLVATQPDVVIVIADATTGPTAISAIDSALVTTRPTYIVNDSIRRPDASAQPFGAALAERVVGVSPQAVVTDVDFESRLAEVDPDATGVFAQNGYACLDLVALAASSARSVRAADIAAAVPGVSGGGSSCRSYASCAALMSIGRNIDFDGPTDELSIGVDGDPSSAVFEEFGFDRTGRDIGLRTFVASSG